MRRDARGQAWRWAGVQSRKCMALRFNQAVMIVRTWREGAAWSSLFGAARNGAIATLHEPLDSLAIEHLMRLALIPFARRLNAMYLRDRTLSIRGGSMFKKLIAVGAVGLFVAVLGACASTSSMRYSGIITAAPEDTHFREVPTRRVALKDRVLIVTHVAWAETEVKGGLHAVRWNWYEGNTLIAERAKTLDFMKTPFRFSGSLPASDLGLGHYRVEVLVDGKQVQEQTFDVVAN
jgi:hypothetical protein